MASGAALGLSLGCKADGDAPVAAPYVSGTPGEHWGDPPQNAAGFMLPPDRRPKRALELFLVGGLNAWDTWYTVPEYGDPARGGPYAGQQLWTFMTGDESVPAYYARCGAGERTLYSPFATDSLKKQVQFGPWAWPLRDRPDILARTRLFVVAHGHEPHQNAIPLMMCGLSRGSPRLCGLGAHVQRYALEHGAGGRRTPYAYTLFTANNSLEAVNTDAASATGLHTAEARPLGIHLLKDNPLPEQLERQSFRGRHEAADRLVAHYLERYTGALTGVDEAARSAALARFANARAELGVAPELGDLLTADVLASFPGEMCGNASDHDGSGLGLKVARRLLTSPVHAPSYVHVVDSGMVQPPFFFGYDTHYAHVRHQATNTVNMARHLADMVAEPGDDDPALINLDDTTILVSTDMGRTPHRQTTTPDGLNHWPYGFAVLAIGGFVGREQQGVFGGIGEDGRAVDFVTPAELRAAFMLGLGIWPFTGEAFRVGDIRDVRDEQEAVVRLREILGYG